MFGEHEAITDAAGIFGPQLIEAYPDAKCVLVVRDFDAWARSVDETLLSYLFSWLGIDYYSASYSPHLSPGGLGTVKFRVPAKFNGTPLRHKAK